jgi:hypothetical protein
LRKRIIGNLIPTSDFHTIFLIWGVTDFEKYTEIGNKGETYKKKKTSPDQRDK